MTASGLRLEGVAQSFGGRRVLQRVDLRVPAGSTLAVLGPNGSGKTTLLRIAAGLRLPEEGRVVLEDGTPVAEARRKGRIGYIPQHLGLVRSATVLQNACMGGLAGSPWWRTLLGKPAPALRERARAALESVGLADRAGTLVRDLSGGERQRAAIARSLVQHPDVLVADELVSSLDARQVRLALRLLDRMKEAGSTVLVSLHHIESALQWADQVAILRDGVLQPPRSPRDIAPEEIPWHA
jgi:ABC-type phosphate/phosphonate transport system ATPase subunit